MSCIGISHSWVAVRECEEMWIELMAVVGSDIACNIPLVQRVEIQFPRQTDGG